jgi:hypothetical protein
MTRSPISTSCGRTSRGRAPRGRLLLSAAACAGCLLAAPGARAAAGPAPQGEEFQVNTVTERVQQSSSVAMDAEGGFAVAWQSEVEGSGDEIRVRLFAARGAPRGEEIAVNAITAGNQNVPAVAMDAEGNFAVAWQTVVSNNTEIRARRFDARGAPQGDEITVNTARGDTQSAPHVAMDADGDFVVAWERSTRGSYEIRARRFAADGTAQGDEIAVNTDPTSSQRFPAVAMNADGRFVVVWRSNVAGSFEIRARRFAPDGTAQGDEIAVNALSAGEQLAPSVGLDGSGAFVVAWENSLDDSYEIRARRFSDAGAPQGEETAVHPATAGNQFSPSVAMNPSGDFVVTWHSQVEGSFEIRGQNFTAAGAPQGELVVINTVVTGTQKSPAVALARDGDFVVTWHSDATGDWEIGARRYDRAPTAARR